MRMDGSIVQFNEIVTLLGAGPVENRVFSESLALGPIIIAADGGAEKALEFGHIPQMVFGDLDSISDAARARIGPERLHQVKEQDTTDFDKTLRSISAPLVLALGFTGGRLDHELAVYNVLVRTKTLPVIVVGSDDICFHLAGSVDLTLPIGTRVSLFPMAEVVCKSTGLHWATDHLTFAPWGRVGTSNQSIAETVTLSSDTPGMLVILPRSELKSAVRALTG